MKHLFLPYELSKLAKQKGFNELCFAFHGKTEELSFMHCKNDEWGSKSTYICTAPLYQQIIDWLREVHKIHIQTFIGHDEDNIWYNFELEPVELGYNYEPYTCATDSGESYYNTLNKAIEEAFKLISLKTDPELNTSSRNSNKVIPPTPPPTQFIREN